MKEIDIPEGQDYEGDFWPGFVDILSGLILALSFLVLVAGIIIALIFKVNVTIIQKEEQVIYKYILAIIEESPLLIDAQFDILDRAEEGDLTQVLVETTKQQLEEAFLRTHNLKENYPDLKKRLEQEIKFLEEEVEERKSPPPQGVTEIAFAESPNADADAPPSINKMEPSEKNWEVRSFGNDLVILFENSSSAKPENVDLLRMRARIGDWLAGFEEKSVTLKVEGALTEFAGLARKDALSRVLFVRDLMRLLDGELKFNISAITEEIPELQDEKNGWILIQRQ